MAGFTWLPAVVGGSRLQCMPCCGVLVQSLCIRLAWVNPAAQGDGVLQLRTMNCAVQGLGVVWLKASAVCCSGIRHFRYYLFRPLWHSTLGAHSGSSRRILLGRLYYVLLGYRRLVECGLVLPASRQSL